MVALRYLNGETSASAKGIKVKVLRRQDQLHVKPTAAEIASPKNRVQDSAISTAKEERELDDQIPKHLPIRIKIRKEKEEKFKDLKNEKWLGDFELEVKNTGDRPIYAIRLLLDMDGVVAPDGNQYGLDLIYGRGNLLDFSEPLKPEDVPINPGETHAFRIAGQYVRGWERFAREQKVAKGLPRKARIRFQSINFGDGTGFFDTAGTPFPRTKQNVGSRATPYDLNKGDPPITWRLIAAREASSPFRMTGSLADFLPAIFLSEESLRPASTDSNLLPDLCCPGTSCTFLKANFHPMPVYAS